MGILKMAVYFALGGSVMCAVTYLGALRQGFLASFVAVFPVMTVLTFAGLYREGGVPVTLDYARGMLCLTPAWLAYVACVMWLLPRRGLPAALLAGVAVYVAGALLTKKILEGGAL